MVERRGLSVLIDATPDALYSFYQGAMAALIARSFKRGLSAPMLTTILAASLLGYLGLLPLLKAGAVALRTAWRIAEPDSLYNPPYAWNVYRFIYFGFIETALGVLLLAVLAWARG